MRFLSGALVLLSMLSVSFQEDPFDIQQRVLSEKLTFSWDSIWNDCNTYVRRPIHEREEAQRYMQCMFGNLPDFIRTWATLNFGVLKEAREMLQEIFGQYMPDAMSDSKQRAAIANIALYAHKKTSAWHQRFAQMIIELGKAGFLDGKEVEDLLRVVQESMNASTSVTRTFIADIQAEDGMSHEVLKERIDTYLTTFESSTKRIVDIY